MEIKIFIDEQNIMHDGLSFVSVPYSNSLLYGIVPSKVKATHLRPPNIFHIPSEDSSIRSGVPSTVVPALITLFLDLKI